MKLNRKSLHAIGNLAFRFWIHVFRRALRKPKPGAELKKFHKNYAADRLAPLSPTEAATLPDYQKCINCGACSAVCPVYLPSRAGSYRAPDSITGCLTRAFPDFGAAKDAVYNCTQCGACARACTRGIDIPGLIIAARRKTVQIADEGILEAYNDRVSAIAMSGSVAGKSCDGLQLFKNPGAEYIFFAGCVGRSKTRETTVKTIEMLNSLGVSLTTIEERCCGGFHRSVGIDLSENPTVRENLDTILAAGQKKIVTACPHGYEVFKKCEPYKSAFRENRISVVHISQLLDGIELPVEKEDVKITYHDPCFLGRRNGLFWEPRAAIMLMGELVEPAQTGESAVCCGSADGTFIMDGDISRAMAQERFNALAATGAEVILTECPSCLSAFKEIENGKIEVNTVSGYLADRIKKNGNKDITVDK